MRSMGFCHVQKGKQRQISKTKRFLTSMTRLVEEEMQAVFDMTMLVDRKSRDTKTLC